MHRIPTRLHSAALRGAFITLAGARVLAGALVVHGQKRRHPRPACPRPPVAWFRIVRPSNELLHEALHLDPGHLGARFALAVNHLHAPAFMGRQGEGSDLYVRGGDPAETPIYVDGARLLHAGRFETLDGSLFGILDPSVMRRAYFSSGGFSARYGNALSGVVDLETDGRPAVARWRAGLNLATVGASVWRPVGVEEALYGIRRCGGRRWPREGLSSHGGVAHGGTRYLGAGSPKDPGGRDGAFARASDGAIGAIPGLGAARRQALGRRS